MLEFTEMKGMVLLFCFVFLVVEISALPTNLPTNQVSSNVSIQELFVNATNDAIKRGIIKLTVDSSSQRSAVNAPTNYDCTVRAVPLAVRRRLRLSTFYTQYAHAYGIPVVSSSRVKRKALERACYVMRFLFADRKDIRDWFYRRNGRAGIMARSEGTTSIPEHSFLPAWWNQRARGLGATIQVPISTGGEENLLCESGDRYYNEDIFLHEFVHGIHNLGATGAIRSFDSRLRAAYYSARARGLWRNTYAMSTDREYFSEGTQSFFNVNAYSARPNGVHNSISTRDKLRRYDPTLYNLVKEVFPCENNFLKRCDAKNGKTPPSFRMDCKNGGGTVVTDKPPKPNTPPVPTPPKPDTPPAPTPPKPDTPPVPTPPKPDTPPAPTPPKPDTPPAPTPPKPDTPPAPTPPKPDTPPVPTPPKPDTPPAPTPPKPDTPPAPTPPKPDTPPAPTPPKPDTPPAPTPPKPDTPPAPTPPKPDTPPVPTPPKPDTPPAPTPPKPDTPPAPTPPKPDTPPAPTPPKPDTPPVPTPPKPDTPPAPTPPKPDTPPAPTPPKPDTPPAPTPPKPDTPPVPTPPKPDTPPAPTPPKPDTPPAPTPPKPDTPPAPTPPKPDTPPVPTPPKPDTPPAPTPPKPDTPPVPTPPKPDTPPVPTPPKPTPPRPTKKTLPPNCYDRNRNCAYWARIGECQRNPLYMRPNCCRSCKSPGSRPTRPRPTCRDYNSYCGYWARTGNCRSNYYNNSRYNYMLRYCRRSCGWCR